MVDFHINLLIRTELTATTESTLMELREIHESAGLESQKPSGRLR